MDLIEELKRRKLFFQCTNEEDMAVLLDNEKVFVYVGLDPTGESLHLGHLIPLITLCHFGRYGHSPIILIGGGTARVGDPAGKTESRPLLTEEQLEHNISKISQQLQKIMGIFNIELIFQNNAEWLNDLHYIDFIRDIGKHFSVSRMLSFDTYKSRLEGGLSFLEFNYQLLQAFDYLHLYRKYGCKIQMGGADQWANIVSGNDLIRRLHQTETFGYTLPLITRSDGAKMGKSEKGAIYLDPEITSPYDFYQYLRNTSDINVVDFLKQYTFIPLEEIEVYESYQGVELNTAKELLSYKLTELIHGTQIAREVQESAKAMFYGSGSQKNVPSHIIESLNSSLSILEVYVHSGLCASRGEARRLIEQGGAKINNNKITDIEYVLSSNDFNKNEAILSAGKKKHIRLIIRNLG